MVEDEAMDMEKDIISNHDICVADEQEGNATEEEENGSSVTNDEESNDIDDGKKNDGDDIMRKPCHYNPHGCFSWKIIWVYWK